MTDYRANSHMTRRAFMLGVTAVASCAGLAAFMGGRPVFLNGTPLQAGAAEANQNNTLTMPVSATVTTLNRVLESMQEGYFQLSGFTDELYYVDGDTTRWYLAESCDVSDDGLTYTLKLRDNLKWHDGEQITADDILFTMACSADTNNGTGFANVAFINEQPVTVNKIDDLTVEFVLPSLSVSYYEVLGQLILIPEHAFDGNTDIVSAPANLTDIGSGPYKLVEFKDGESLVLERFDDYYLGAPSIDRLVYRVIGNASSQEVAFRNGEINFLNITSDLTADQYSKTEGVQVIKLAEGRVNYLAWNKFCPTWENRDAVKALFLAMNLDEMVQGAYGQSMGVPANTIFSNRTSFYDKDVKGYGQDLDTARELAQSSGLSGKTIRLYYNADRAYVGQTALVIQQQLRAIDVNVEAQGLESNGFFDVVFADGSDYELYLNGYGAQGDPDGVVNGMYNGTWGINVDTSQEILDLFEKGSATVDRDERAKIYAELQQRAVDEYLVYPIAYPNICFAVPSNLKGADTYDTTPLFEDFTQLSFE